MSRHFLVSFFALIAIMIMSLCLALPAHSEDREIKLSPEQTNRIIEMTLDRIRKSRTEQCTDDKVLACMGMSKNQCLTIRNEIIDDCLIPAVKSQKNQGFDHTSFAKLQSQYRLCSVKVAQKHSVDIEKYLGCSPDNEYQD